MPGNLFVAVRHPLPIMVKFKVQHLVLIFIHKMKVCLKELRETRIWLLMIVKAILIKPTSKLEPLIHENNELISIFVTSVKTVK